MDAIIYFCNNKKFSDQLNQILNKVAFNEFPAYWADLPGKISDNLNSNDSQKIKGALMVLCEVTDVCTHNYTCRLQNDKTAFNSVFMHFENVVRNLISNLAVIYAVDEKRDFNDQNHIICAEIMNLCCSFMKISCKVEIPN